MLKMKSWPKILALVTTIALLGGGVWVERTYGLITQQVKDPEQPTKKKKNKKNKKATAVPGGRSLAFDVAAGDYRVTSKYVLEITDRSGKVINHDINKPKRQRGTITVTLPALTAGTYQIVVAAQGAAGTMRSAPLKVEIQ